MNPIVSVLALTVMWVVLWGQLDVRSVLGGLVVSILLVLVLRARDKTYFDAFRPLHVLGFFVRYGWLVLVSNAVVAWEILTPGSRVREGIIAIHTVDASDAVVNALAHAISGTPGTLVMDIDRAEKTVFYVHVLHLHDIERARRDILKLQLLLIRAIGSKVSLADVEQRLAAHRRDHPLRNQGEDR